MTLTNHIPRKPMLLLLLLALSPPDSLASLYAANDSAGLARLYARAPQSAGDDLLYRYRLYPLTDDPRYLDGLPDERACRTARDFALLSALWGWRAETAPPWKLPFYGLRTDGLLERARALDPDDPYVLLVGGQSLLFRPSLFGRDPEAALAAFERLREVLRATPAPGLSLFEPEVWVWYTLRALGRPHTDRVRDRLLAQDPPPLFRAFLLDPP